MTAALSGKVLARFAGKYRIDDAGCWIWTGKINRDGYGRMSIRGQWRIAHRVAHELLIGPIPDQHDVDHLYRVRACVNPAHLEAVTHQINQQRIPYVAAKMAQAECKRGHTYTDANTRIDGRGSRSCRTCHNDRERARKAAARATVVAA